MQLVYVTHIFTTEGDAALSNFSKNKNLFYTKRSCKVQHNHMFKKEKDWNSAKPISCGVLNVWLMNWSDRLYGIGFPCIYIVCLCKCSILFVCNRLNVIEIWNQPHAIPHSKCGNSAHTCTDHNGNSVRWTFDFWHRHFVNRNLNWIFLDGVGSDQSGGILSPFMGTACWTCPLEGHC